MTTVFNEEYHTDVTVADIYVRNIQCFRRIYGKDKFKSGKLTVQKMTQSTSGILYLNGDSADCLKAGLCVGNGTVWREKHNNKRDVCVILRDGTMYCYQPQQMKESGLYENLDQVWQSFLFGPSLLDENGEAITDKHDFTTTEVFPGNPRSAIGYYEPGHYCFMAVSGRHTASLVAKGKHNDGADLLELSKLMHDLGCVCAYNLDGGQSSEMWFGGSYINNPYKKGRGVGDALVICEPDADISLTD